jgi:hypothetical protein
MDSLVNQFSGISVNNATTDDEVARLITRLTFQDDTPLAGLDVVADEPADREQIFSATIQPPAPSIWSEQPRPNADAALSSHDGCSYKLLWGFDEELDRHMKDILMRLDALASPEEPVQDDVLLHLAGEEEWLKNIIQEVSIFEVSDGIGGIRKHGMLDRLENFAAAVDCYTVLMDWATTEAGKLRGFDTSKTIHPYLSAVSKAQQCH